MLPYFITFFAGIVLLMFSVLISILNNKNEQFQVYTMSTLTDMHKLTELRTC